MTRRYDPRRARPYLTYTAAELAQCFDVGISAIRNWTSKGLKPIDNRRPYCFAGPDVQAFLIGFNKPRQPTGAGEIYCVACKRVIRPAGNVVDYVDLSPSSGDLVGVCPQCERRVFQRVRRDDLARKAGSLTIRFEDGTATMELTGEPPHSDPSEDDCS